MILYLSADLEENVQIVIAFTDNVILLNRCSLVCNTFQRITHKKILFFPRHMRKLFADNAYESTVFLFKYIKSH